MSYLKYLFIIFIVFVLTGCNSQQQLQKTPQKHPKFDTYFYYEQNLIIPKEFENKLFTWTVPVKEFYPKDFNIKGVHLDNIFVIKKNQPTFFANFENTVEVVKLRVKLLENIQKLDNVSNLNDAINKSMESIVSLPFEILSNALGKRILYSPKNIAISLDNKTWHRHELKKENFKKEYGAFIINNPFGKNKTIKSKQYTLKILSLHGIGMNKKVITKKYYPDEVTYLVKDLNIEKEVIKYNLMTRRNTSLNEDLIRSIAIDNPSLFRELQFNKINFNLDPTSLLKLPTDIKISYGLKNFSTIIKTGKYKDYKNRYKRFNVNKTFSTKEISYKKATSKIYVDRSKPSKPKLKQESNDDNSFIDFDKGI